MASVAGHIRWPALTNHSLQNTYRPLPLAAFPAVSGSGQWIGRWRVRWPRMRTRSRIGKNLRVAEFATRSCQSAPSSRPVSDRGNSGTPPATVLVGLQATAPKPMLSKDLHHGYPLLSATREPVGSRPSSSWLLAACVADAGAQATARNCRTRWPLTSPSGEAGTARIILNGDQAHDRPARVAASPEGAPASERRRRARSLHGVARRTCPGPGVPAVADDAPVFTSMAVTAPAVGADQVWDGAAGAAAYTGRGIGVALIDSGISRTRTSRGASWLRRRLRAAERQRRRRVRPRHARSRHHRGQWASTTRASRPARTSSACGSWPRTAAAARATSLPRLTGWSSNGARYGIRIVNLSLGHPVTLPARFDPLVQAVERAVAAGFVVVTSAGNFGKTADGTPVIGGVTVPGNAPSAITVGAINTKDTVARGDDVMATYSSRGPTAIRRVPEAGPRGAGQQARVDGGGRVRRSTTSYPERRVGDGAGAYLEMSGTSMAAAVVSRRGRAGARGEPGDDAGAGEAGAAVDGE